MKPSTFGETICGLSAAATALTLLMMTSFAQAAAVVDEAVEWWAFEGDTAGSRGIDLVSVGTDTAKLSPEVALEFTEAKGVGTANSGTKAVEFDGQSVLKTGERALRLGGSQTFWIRVNFSEIRPKETALMARSRPRDTLRGIALQLEDGTPTGYISGDGQLYDAQVALEEGAPLQAGKWYDIALRYVPDQSLSIDVFDAETGKSVGSARTTEGIPSSLQTSNAIGSGYFQIGAINTGSAGSAWPVPSGTRVEAAGVWDRALSDDDLRELSQAGSP